MRVVAFPFHDWRKAELEGLRTRDLHVLDHLSRHPSVDDVLVVDRPTTLVERAIRRRGPFVAGERVWERRDRGHRARLARVDDGLLVLDTTSPDVVGPLFRGRGWWFDAFRDPVTLELLIAAVGNASFGDAAIIAWTPPPAPAIERLAPRRLVYDSLDNWLIHPSLRRQHKEADRAYRALLPRADTVFVSAPASAAALEAYSDRIVVLPNGVDTGPFERPRTRPSDLPGPPIVGYVGKLAERIDGELVAETAARLPNVTFVFVGPVLSSRAVGPLRRSANVRLLGDRPYDAMPSYVRAFDIAWIPHRVGEGETGGDPMKLYEYWAAGRQVVATPIDGLDQWSNSLHLVSDASEAAAVIGGLLAGTTMRRPVLVPADRTWASITDRIVVALTSVADR